MTELPKVFDGAEFVEPDAATLATLSPEATKCLGAIRRTYAETKKAELQVEAAQTEITAALAQEAAAEETVKPFGEYSFHRLWQQSVHGV